MYFLDRAFIATIEIHSLKILKLFTVVCFSADTGKNSRNF